MAKTLLYSLAVVVGFNVGKGLLADLFSGVEVIPMNDLFLQIRKETFTPDIVTGLSHSGVALLPT